MLNSTVPVFLFLFIGRYFTDVSVSHINMKSVSQFGWSFFGSLIKRPGKCYKAKGQTTRISISFNFGNKSSRL